MKSCLTPFQLHDLTVNLITKVNDLLKEVCLVKLGVYHGPLRDHLLRALFQLQTLSTQYSTDPELARELQSTSPPHSPRDHPNSQALTQIHISSPLTSASAETSTATSSDLASSGGVLDATLITIEQREESLRLLLLGEDFIVPLAFCLQCEQVDIVDPALRFIGFILHTFPSLPVLEAYTALLSLVPLFSTSVSSSGGVFWELEGQEGSCEKRLTRLLQTITMFLTAPNVSLGDDSSPVSTSYRAMTPLRNILFVLTRLFRSLSTEGFSVVGGGKRKSTPVLPSFLVDLSINSIRQALELVFDAALRELPARESQKKRKIGKMAGKTTGKTVTEERIEKTANKPTETIAENTFKVKGSALQTAYVPALFCILH